MDKASAKIRILLLGPTQLIRDDKRRRPHSVKTIALLAYLVCQPEVVHTRELLATLLWGNVPDPNARHSLRQALYSLRRMLGELAETCLDVDTHTVTFHAMPDLFADFLAFDELIDAGDFMEAVALYRGELLEGIAIDESPAFEEWLFLARDRTAQRMIAATQTVVDQLLFAGDSDRAIQFGERLVTLDPLNEGAYQRLMQAQAVQGDRDATRRTYHKCRDILARELGVEPMAETTALFEGLFSSGSFPQQVSTDLSPAPAPDFPFLGCKAELARLDELHKGAMMGRTSLVFIKGEAGIGKTELVFEFWRRANRKHPLLLLNGHAYESQLETPYTMWAEALSTLNAPEMQNRLDGLAPIWRGQLSRLVPEISTASPDDRNLTSAESQLRFMQGIVQSLIHLAASDRVMLFFDDLHWSDTASLELLHYVARQCRPHPILIVGTYRSDAIRGEGGLGRFFSQRRYETITMSAIKKSDIEVLLERLGYDDASNAATRLTSHSQGNRLMLFETLRFLQDSNNLDLLFSDERLPIPPRVQELIVSRLSRLSERHSRVLAAAAVIGRPLDLPLLHQVSGQSELSLLDDVAMLAAHTFLEEKDIRNLEQIAFHHDFVRQVTYAELSPSHRRALHRRTADALLNMHQSQSYRVVEEVAYHYEKASDAKALFFLQLASEQAEKLFALVEATNFLSRAINFQSQYFENDLISRFEILLARESLLAQQGYRAAQAKDIAELISLAESLDDPIHLAQACLRQAGYLSDIGETLASKDAAEQAMSRYREEQDQQGEAKALRELGFLYWSTDEYSLALSYNRQALQMHRRLGNIEGEASALHNLAEIHRGLNSPRKAVSFYEQSLQLSWARRDYQRQSLSLYGMAHALRQLDQSQRALETYRQTLKQAELARDNILLSRVHHETATLLTELGDLESAFNAMHQAVDVSRESGYTTGLAHSLVGLAYLHTRQGKSEEARIAFKEAIECFKLLEDGASLEYVSKTIKELDVKYEIEQPPPNLGWVKTYVTLNEGKVYCEFESPLATQKLSL
jgi:DNA-binding SARP family transcriptional activator/predicted ATPase